MSGDDFLEPEVGMAVAATAILATPVTRRLLRRAAVYGLSGLLAANDAFSSWLSDVARSASTDTETDGFEDITRASTGTDTLDGEGGNLPGRR